MKGVLVKINEMSMVVKVKLKDHYFSKAVFVYWQCLYLLCMTYMSGFDVTFRTLN